MRCFPSDSSFFPFAVRCFHLRWREITWESGKSDEQNEQLPMAPAFVRPTLSAGGAIIAGDASSLRRGKKRREKGGKKQKRKKRTKDVPHKRTCLGAGISGPRTRGFRPQDNIGRQRAMREKLRQKRRSCGRPSEIQWSARATSPGKCSPRESEPRSGGSLEKRKRAIAVICRINEQRGSGVQLTSRTLLATQLAETGIN